MSLALRPRAIPQCTACIRSSAWSSFVDSTAGWRQQVRGKKKMANAGSTVPVRLLKDVKTFGRKGAIVPISIGQMRNKWFPLRIAEYVTQTEQRTLRLRNISAERDFDFGNATAVLSKQSLTADETVDAKGMSGDEKAEASMFQKKKVDMDKLSPERSEELLEIFVRPTLEFYRQPIIEEVKEPEPPAQPEPKRPRSLGLGAGAELLEARMSQPAPPSPTKAAGPQAIYGSVSTHDVLIAIRAAMAENDEAARVVLQEDDVRFVDLMREDETDRVKFVGEYAVEIKPKGAEEGVRRRVRVVAQEGA